MRQQAVIVNNYLTSVVSLYQESSKEKKGEVLDIAELVTQRSRKQLIKRLGRMRSPQPILLQQSHQEGL